MNGYFVEKALFKHQKFGYNGLKLFSAQYDDANYSDADLGTDDV